jgi:hypothetical protein
MYYVLLGFIFSTLIHPSSLIQNSAFVPLVITSSNLNQFVYYFGRPLFFWSTLAYTFTHQIQIEVDWFVAWSASELRTGIPYGILWSSGVVGCHLANLPSGYNLHIIGIVDLNLITTFLNIWNTYKNLQSLVPTYFHSNRSYQTYFQSNRSYQNLKRMYQYAH